MTNPVYKTPHWRAVRLRVLERDQHQCQIRRPGCTGHATEVDHITSMSDGGAKFDPANLRAACKKCNVGQRNADVARRARGEAPATGPVPVGHWHWRCGRPPTREEYLAETGYDGPEPPSGWYVPGRNG